MKELLIKLVLLIIAIVLGVIVYYFAPLSSLALEHINFNGKLLRPEAEQLVKEAGYNPQYSWYVLEELTPVIKVMSEKNGRYGEIAIQAFTGSIVMSEFDQIKAQPQTDTVSRVNNTTLDDAIFQQIVQRYPSFELIGSRITNEWGSELLYVEFWADEHYVQMSFDKAFALQEINERFWKEKTTAITDTIPPEITILYPADGDVFPQNTASIEVVATVSDDTDPNPIIDGTGTVQLEDGYNTIIVAATDNAGNASSSFVIVEREL